MENIYQTVIDSLHNEVMTLRKQVKKLENEAQIVQAGLDFLEIQELNEELENEIESKRLDKEISEKFKRLRDSRILANVENLVEKEKRDEENQRKQEEIKTDKVTVEIEDMEDN